MSTGFTQEGFPWIGSENADLVITEFTDYLCFQCNKMHHYLRKLVTRYPGKIKIIHRHFPMDSRFNPIVQNPFHEGSGALSLLAVYAETEGKFWQISDYLFANARGADRIDLRSLAETFKIDYDKLSRSFGKRAIWFKLHKDIMDGINLGVTGTPAFLIDGKLYSAQIPPEILSKVMD
jgi:protein-disulfide isomerase